MKERVNELFIRLSQTTDRWDFIELMDEIMNNLRVLFRNEEISFTDVNFIDDSCRALFRAR